MDIDETFTDSDISIWNSILKPSFSLSVEAEPDLEINQYNHIPSPNLHSIINHLHIQIPPTITPYVNLHSLLKPQKLPLILPTPTQTLSQIHQAYNPKIFVPNWIVEEVNRLFNVGNIICSSFEYLPNHTKKFLFLKVSMEGTILKPSNWSIPSVYGIRKDLAVQLLDNNTDKSLTIREPKIKNSPLMGFENTFIVHLEDTSEDGS